MFGLALTVAVLAGPLDDAWDAYVAADNAVTESLYQCELHGGIVEDLGAELDELLEDSTEEELGSELWVRLEAAWQDVQAAHDLYAIGLELLDEGNSYWDDYNAATTDEERIAVLVTITGFYWDANDCFVEAADDYFALEGELAELYDDLDAQLEALAIQAIASMNVARGEMLGQKAVSALQAGRASTKRSEANAERDAAVMYTPTNQAEFNALMAAGDALMTSGNGLYNNGDAALSSAQGLEQQGDAKKSQADDIQLSWLQRYRSATDAIAKFNQAKAKYVESSNKYDSAWSDFFDARTKFLAAQTK